MRTNKTEHKKNTSNKTVQHVTAAQKKKYAIKSRKWENYNPPSRYAQDEDLKKTIEESAQLQRAYERYFDTVLVNNNFEKTFEQLKDVIESLSTEPQWVPISWVY